VPTEIGVDPAALSVVRDGLFLATQADYGTASGIFGKFAVPVAGKTGTAEKVVTVKGPGGKVLHNGLLDQSWWCGWGPFDGGTWKGKSPIVVCALIENGGFGGEAAAPAALRVFEQHFGVKAPEIAKKKSD
jgi:penicillin-binding protein 2